MSELAILGYAAVAGLYAFLAILLILNWRGQVIGGLLIAACVANVVWAGVLGAGLHGLPIPTIATFSAEVVRTGVWLSFLAVLVNKIGAGRIISRAGPVMAAGVLLTGSLTVSGLGIIPRNVDLTLVLNAGGLLMAMTGLLLVEQLHRNTRGESRPGVKALLLGVGGIFAYDLFLYSQNLLLGGVEPWAWMARGIFNAAIVPIIAIAARRNEEWELRIFVSRQVVFYTTTLVAVGIYLLLMSAVGYWIVIQGRTWSSFASILFLVGAAILLVVLLFSARLRARFRVFLSKHFFRNKYDYRSEWLRLISTLAEIEESTARKVAVKALAQVVQSPSGLLWLIDEENASYEMASSYHTSGDTPAISAQDPLVDFVRNTGWIVDLEEYRRNPDVYGNMQLPVAIGQRDEAWLVAPLLARNELLGLILLDKGSTPLKLNYEDRDLLKTVCNHVAVHLMQERTDELLSESRQFEAYNRLTAFLMHDLKNLVAQQSLIVANAAKHKRNPDFVDDAMNTIANSVDRMKSVMAQLRRGEAEVAVRPTELRFAVSAAADRCSGQVPIPELVFDDEGAIVEVDRERLVMILMHLIRNAQDSTGADGKITVSTSKSDGDVRITVADNGCGMSKEFVRDRLFRPFDTTKGSQGMGIGAYQAREFARKLGGDLKVESELSVGTSVTLSLPLSRYT